MQRYFPSAVQWIVSAIAVLFTTNLVAFVILAQARTNASQIGTDLLKCQSLAKQISNLRSTLPQLQTATDSKVQDEIAPLREQLLEANISETHISSIAVRGRTVIKKSAFERVDTGLALTRLDRQSIFRFINAYEMTSKNAICSSIELSSIAGSGIENGDLWNADLVLTQIVHKPFKDKTAIR